MNETNLCKTISNSSDAEEIVFKTLVDKSKFNLDAPTFEYKSTSSKR